MQSLIPIDFTAASLHRQGAYLKDCLNIPSDSGNAEIQLSPIPDISKMSDAVWCSTQSVPNTQNPIIQVYQCYNLIICFELVDNLGNPYDTVLQTGSMYIRCNIYSNNGVLLKQQAIPDAYWANESESQTFGAPQPDRPLAIEFIGTIGCKYVQNRESSKCQMYGLSQSELLSKGEEVLGVAGAWQPLPNMPDWELRSYIPVYLTTELNSQVIVKRNVLRTLSCWCNNLDGRANPNWTDPDYVRTNMGYVDWPTVSYDLTVQHYVTETIDDGTPSSKYILLKRCGEVFVIDSDNLSKDFNIYSFVGSNSLTYQFMFIESNISIANGAHSVGWDVNGNPSMRDANTGLIHNIVWIGSAPPMKFLSGVPRWISQAYVCTQNQDNSTEQNVNLYKEIQRKMIAYGIGDQLGIISKLPPTGYMKYHVPDNEYVLWIEALANRVFVVTRHNKFYYSDANTLNINGLSYYETEYLNAAPRAIVRISNRLAVFSDKTLEMWDLTNDFENPVSPRQASQCHTIIVMPNSIVRFQDGLYFAGRTNELPSISFFTLTAEGQLSMISYPQLDVEVNKLFRQPGPEWKVNTASVIQYNNLPILQWKINGKVIALNLAFKQWLEMSKLYFYYGRNYWQHFSSMTGWLSYFISVAKFKSPNYNFKSDRATVAGLELDFETTGFTRDIWINFHRISGHMMQNQRRLVINAFSAKRNMRGRINVIGKASDISTELQWIGETKFNQLAYAMQ